MGTFRWSQRLLLSGGNAAKKFFISLRKDDDLIFFSKEDTCNIRLVFLSDDEQCQQGPFHCQTPLQRHL